MSRSRVIFFFLSVCCLVPIVASSLSGADRGRDEDSLSRQLSVFSEVLSLVRRAYVEETDSEELLTGALDGVTDALDPLSTFVPADHVEDFLEIRGVGDRRSGVTLGKERGITYVIAVRGGSPAEIAGVEHGDLIAKIDGRSTRRMPLWRLQEILAGEPGTSLDLELLHRGQKREVSLTLVDSATPSVELAEKSGIAVIRLPSIEPAMTLEVQRALESLDRGEQDKLVLDLRGVAGGAPETAFSIAELFTNGTLGKLAGSGDGAEITFQGMSEPRWRGELVVLQDGGTQGAAEILASVLRQKVGARLVGRRSFGHAGRQALLPLSDGSRLLLTDAFYSGPDGQPIDKGLDPDLEVDEDDRRFAGDEVKEDHILERGLELLLADQEERQKKVA